MIQIYTGDGKGKTTAALGQCFRAAGHGLRSIVFTFMKGFIEYGELTASRKTDGLITIIQCGRAEFVNKENPEQIDIDMARDGWQKALNAAENPAYDILVLDELCVALDFTLLDPDEVISFIKKWPRERELLITGRYCPENMIKEADLVTHMKEVKHYYTRGIESRKGIEY